METTSQQPAEGKGWNQKNPAIRRIMADIRELAREPSDQYAAKPVEENMFEWHFVLRGPQGTDFEGGRYHGKILLPAEYPFKPPNIMFLTPNGRWEIKTKICLSMSAYHPEDWQPAWGIRTMLEALISFMPSPSDGALGAMDCTSEVRRRLAVESVEYTHPLMPKLPESGSCSYNNKSKELQEAVAQMRFAAKEGASKEGSEDEESPSTKTSSASSTPAAAEQESSPAAAEQESSPAPAAAVAASSPPVVASAEAMAAEQLSADRVDDVLRITSWFVLFAIFVLVYRKLLLTFAPEL